MPNWAIDVFPDGAMYNVTLLEYDLLSTTPLQRQLNGGTLLKEIIGNSLKYKIGDLSKKQKIILYSGDERNIVGVLKNLDLWSPHMPNEAAALIFELYFDNDTDIYGMKVTFILFSCVCVYYLLFYLTFLQLYPAKLFKNSSFYFYMYKLKNNYLRKF